MSKNIKINIFWNTFGGIFYSICQWVLTIVVVKLTSYETAGYLSLAMTTSSSFSAISLFSMRNYQVSDVTEEYTNNVYVGSRILTCIAAFFFCFFSSLFTNTLYQTLCVMAFMVIRIAESMVDVLHGINQKYERYDYIGISYIIRGIITVCFFSIILKLSKNLPLTLIIVAVLNISVAICYDWKKTYSIDGFHITICDKKTVSLLKKCLPIVIFNFLLSLENLIPKTLLQEEYGAAQLGIYSSMASPTLVVQLFASVAFTPFLPIISNAIYNRDKDKFKDMLRKIYLAFIVMCVIVTVGAALLGEFGLQILFGKDILQYYSNFMPIVWCTILTGIVWVLSSVIVSLRKTRSLLFGMIIDFIICIMLSRYLIILMGMNGVSVVQIVVLAIYIIYMIIVCEKEVYRL